MSLSTLVLRLTHTGVDKDDKPFTGSIFIPDLETGLEYQGRKSAVYVPFEGSITIPIANRVMYSMYSGAIKKFVDDGYLTAETLVNTGNTTSPFTSGGDGACLAARCFVGGVTLSDGQNTALSATIPTVAQENYMVEISHNTGGTGTGIFSMVVNEVTIYGATVNADVISTNYTYFTALGNSTSVNFTVVGGNGSNITINGLTANALNGFKIYKIEE